MTMTTLEKILKHFQNMAESAVNLSGDDETIKELSALLLITEWETADGLAKDHLQDEGRVITVSWSVEDVMSQADEGDKLTEDDTKKILSDVYKYHDASVGINWDVIRCHIDDYIDKFKSK